MRGALLGESKTREAKYQINSCDIQCPQAKTNTTLKEKLHIPIAILVLLICLA